ncbi:MAG: PEP-CTERM sorting domain-containing protein [Acidobacteria bacterium]|nr:PEP-CTERM sorting domain-containing protein [Acidobacteriota bacterium]
MIRKLSLVLTAVILFALTAQAALIIGLPENGSNYFPFGSSNGTRYQQVYAASEFPGPMTITGLTFYADSGTVASGTYTVHLSTTAAAVDALSSTFALNVGADDALFAVFNGGGSASPSFTIIGTPFFYDPGNGNLLMDIFVANSGSGAPIHARNNNATGQFSRMHNFGSGFEHYGLVTGFESEIIIPEPSTWAMLAGGLLALLGARRKR